MSRKVSRHILVGDVPTRRENVSGAVRVRGHHELLQHGSFVHAACNSVFLLLVCVLLLFRFLSLLALVLYRNNVTPMLLRKLQCLRRLVPSVALASTRLR